LSVQRIYVGEPGGENLDVARETGGKQRFQPGDTVEVSEELAERLDRSWAAEEEAQEQLDVEIRSAEESQEIHQVDESDVDAEEEPVDENEAGEAGQGGDE
jgi:hypothetical protein